MPDLPGDNGDNDDDDDDDDDDEHGQANEIKHNDGEQRSLLAVAWQRTRRG